MPPLAEIDANRAANRKKSSQKTPQKLLSKTPSMEAPNLHDTAVAIVKRLQRKRPFVEEEEVIPETENDDESGHTEEKESVSDEDVPETLQYDCDQVRTKINSFLRSGEMKVGEFQNHIGVSSSSYYAFMKQKGSAKGAESDIYGKAHNFFVEREKKKKGVEMPRAKKQKVDNKKEKERDQTKEDKTDKPTTSKAKPKSSSTTKKNDKKNDDKYDVSSITLPDEERGRVPVFDTCQDIRTKIRAHLRIPGVTQAGFGRTIGETYKIAGLEKHEHSPVDGRAITSFLSKNGPSAGASSGVFYASYVYFEKLRIKQGKAKSKKRQEMEEVHGRAGMDTTTGENSRIWCGKNERPYQDKYGKTRFMPV